MERARLLARRRYLEHYLNFINMAVELQKIKVSAPGSPGDSGTEAADKIYDNDAAILALFPKTRTPVEYDEAVTDAYYLAFDGSGPTANGAYRAVAIPVADLPSPLFASATTQGGALALVVWMNGAVRLGVEYMADAGGAATELDQVQLNPPSNATEGRFTVLKTGGDLQLFTDVTQEGGLLTEEAGDARYVKPDVPSNNLLDKDAIVHGSGINGAFGIQVVGPGTPYGYVVAPAKPNTDYIYSGSADPNRVRFEDADGTLIGGFDPATAVPVQNAPPYKWTTPANTARQLVGTQSGGANTDDALNLNEGDVVQPLEPYGNFIDEKYIPPSIPRADQVRGPWYGKTIVLYGDSQVAFNRYPPLLAALLGCTIVLKGVGGTAVTPGYGAFPANSLNAAARMADVEAAMLNADLLIICAGGNDEIDSGNGLAPIGNRAVIPNQATTPNNYYEACKRLINYFQTSPNAKSKSIAWAGLTSNHGALVSRFDNYELMRSYSDATADSCAQYGVPFWNCLAESGLSRENEAVYTLDGTHLNDAGAAMYARRMAAFINRL